jgi:DNA-binding TFAR19-related protein (PDSD5 family)
LNIEQMNKEQGTDEQGTDEQGTRNEKRETRNKGILKKHLTTQMLKRFHGSEILAGAGAGFIGI